MSKKEYINNRNLKKNVVEKRVYQELLTASALKQNTLVVAPTGLGKTIVGILLISYIYNKKKNILFLSPTKPLISQHKESLENTLSISNSKILLITGSISPKKRKKLYNQKGIIICATPQTIRNDLRKKYINTKNFNLLIFDEAHKAVGNYSYCEVSKNFSKDIRRLALTASPGSDKKKIKDVTNNLEISNIEIRTEEDLDVIDYIKNIEIDTKFLKLDLTSRKISNLIENFINKKIELLQRLHIKISKNFSKKHLLNLQRSIFAKINKSTKKNKFNFIAISAITTILKFLHAKELIESQGFYVFEKYLHKLLVESKKKKSRAASQIVNSKEFSKILKLVHKNPNKKYSKVKKLEEITQNFIQKEPNSKILVFSKYRDNANYLSKQLNKFKDLNVARFVGQANKKEDKGLSQKEQGKILDKFRKGKYNILVCTSVGEEGLDIPAVDLVIFYDMVASEIRQIQRRGRTGRFSSGKVILLINKNTIDETYYYVSLNKEKKMKRLLNNFDNNKQSKKSKKKNSQKKIFDY